MFRTSRPKLVLTRSFLREARVFDNSGHYCLRGDYWERECLFRPHGKQGLGAFLPLRKTFLTLFHDCTLLENGEGVARYDCVESKKIEWQLDWTKKSVDWKMCRHAPSLHAP